MSVEARDLETRNTVASVGLVSAGLSFLLVATLALLANRLSHASKLWLGRELLEYPLWAVGLGLLVNLLISATSVRNRLSAAFRTEFFLKTGLVLMGATINFTDILRVGAKGMLQAILVVTAVFFFTWHLSAWKPVTVYFLATVANTASALGAAVLLFGTE